MVRMLSKSVSEASNENQQRLMFYLLNVNATQHNDYTWLKDLHCMLLQTDNRETSCAYEDVWGSTLYTRCPSGLNV